MHPDDLIVTHFRTDTSQKRALAKLRIVTILDLLYHFPVRYEDPGNIRALHEVKEGEDVIVYGRIGGLEARKSWKSKRPIAEGWVEDGTARIKIIWFNQPYMAKTLHDGSFVKLSGKISGAGHKVFIANPEVEPIRALPEDRPDTIFSKEKNTEAYTLFPIYPESKGVTSRWFTHAIKKVFEAGALTHLHDPIPEAIRKKYNLYDVRDAFRLIHTPINARHAESARKRFAFEEIFAIQTKHAITKSEISAATTYQFSIEEHHVNEFIKTFPFELTGAQKSAVDTIRADLCKKTPMSRLIEGDVGSGKTAIAATCTYAVTACRPDSTKDYGNLQVAYMAPTEILAKQHFESFIEYFRHLPITIGLITGSGCMKYPSKVNPTKPTTISKTQLLKWVANGEIHILIGTHALVYKKVTFKHLAQVIIDEQHRFGTAQRRSITKKGAPLPHLLSMTATPIPRTLALTMYGDLDITLLDEMPKGRKQVKTELISRQDTDRMYDHIRSEIESGRQAYVICPRIDEPDPEKETALEMKSVIAEAARLKAGPLSGVRIDILHGKMTPSEKTAVMERFLRHEIDVLVATSVIEVGVNVPNATNIIIEGAERFGLSQLHQLRGRVIRGTHQPYCFVTTSNGVSAHERLKVFTRTTSGFSLAEHDLTLRGAGELYGRSQSGMTDLGMDALKNLKLVEAARTEAQNLVARDILLADNPHLLRRMNRLESDLHME